ncbi:UDP-N-acetylmuramoyl-tripeptide--D-alanyl-D-alanine ligase [Phycisphaerales bacterium]|nr:UDP-N-acetylmuramoyl-tripeptide--D-alanyl-D-alanine ligase [Phycisphaerales bacterium]
MNFWTMENLKALLGGGWLARGDAPELSGLSIDTRTLRPRQVFLALKGERTDGHAYLADAVAAGAGLLVIDDARAMPAGGFGRAVGVIQVANTGAALLKLGAAYRRTLENTRVIAVGGSNGKTTTVRLVHAALTGSLRGSHSPKSFNNAVGVPLTLLAAKRTDQYLICEVGTNAPGEIAPLAEAIEPDVAVITSIGREHLEGLGSLEGVIREEVTLLKGLREGGVAVLNADAPRLVEAARPIVAAQKGTILTFGFSDAADLRITRCGVSGRGTEFTLNDRHELRLPIPGTHNATNGAAAVAVARRLGVDHAVIEAGLAGASGAPMRMEREDAAGVRFVNDAYNANPESMLAAIETFGAIARGGDSAAGGRVVVMLGDMLELGEQSAGAHREVGRAVAGCGWIDLAVFVGPMMGLASDEARAALGEKRVAALANLDGERPSRAAELLRAGDLVLLKGSRGTGMERVLDAVRAREPARLEPKPAGGPDR